MRDGHDHGHAHTHGHRPGQGGEEGCEPTAARRLGRALALTGAILVAEVVGGVMANSMALLADAGHVLADVGALGLALFAIRFAQRPPTAARTFGFHRAEILAALVNGATLLAIAAWVAFEAVGRLRAPPHVAGGTALLVATGGLVVNLVSLLLLHGDKSASLNVRGAWLHVLMDALGSVGAITSSALIFWLGWEWADPVASLAIAGLVVWSSWALLRESVAVLMEGAPGHIDVDEVHSTLGAVEGVAEVHDLHVWSITSGREALSGHVVVAGGVDPSRQLGRLKALLRDRFGISHVTLQIEVDPCEDAVCPRR